MDGELEKLLKKSPHFTKKDILTLEGVRDNPIAVILVRKFTKNGILDAKSLISALYQFTLSKNLLEKLNFLFGIYDSDGDGYISNAEMFELLKMLNKGVLEDSKLQDIVDTTFYDVPNYSNKMNFNQFKSLVEKRSKNLAAMFNCEKSN